MPSRIKTFRLDNSDHGDYLWYHRLVAFLPEGMGQKIFDGVVRWLAFNRWFWPSVVAVALFVVPFLSKEFAPVRAKLYERGYTVLAHGFTWAGLGLESVNLVNNTSLSDEEVTLTMGLKPVDSIMLIDGEALRQRLEAHPRISSASVHKLLPNGLSVRVVPREALSRWQDNGQVYVVDRAGVVIEDHGRFTDNSLPLVVGKGANIVAHSLLDGLDAYPAIGEHLSYAHFVSARRWDLHLTFGTRVLLPPVKLDEGLRLVDELLRTTDIARQRPARLDVRLRDRFIISVEPVAVNAVGRGV